MSLIAAVAVLVFLTIHEASSIGDQGMNLRCRCITKEKKPIGRYISELEINPPNSHCRDTELIATLKKDGKKVCLDPDAPWVKRVLRKLSGETS